ncbi:hypothetical protein MTO96_037759, partial [Rhipicephalus appendiculatus]
ALRQAADFYNPTSASPCPKVEFASAARPDSRPKLSRSSTAVASATAAPTNSGNPSSLLQTFGETPEKAHAKKTDPSTAFPPSPKQIQRKRAVKTTKRGYWKSLLSSAFVATFFKKPAAARTSEESKVTDEAGEGLVRRMGSINSPVKESFLRTTAVDHRGELVLERARLRRRRDSHPRTTTTRGTFPQREGTVEASPLNSTTNKITFDVNERQQADSNDTDVARFIYRDGVDQRRTSYVRFDGTNSGHCHRKGDAIYYVIFDVTRAYHCQRNGSCTCGTRAIFVYTEVFESVQQAVYRTPESILWKPEGDGPEVTHTTEPPEAYPSVNGVRVRLGLDADYGACVRGREWQFREHIRRQLSVLLRVPLPGVRNVRVLPGSIIVEAVMVPVKTPSLEVDRSALLAARTDLQDRIDRGTAVVTDLDGNRLPIFTSTVYTLQPPRGTSYSPALLGGADRDVLWRHICHRGLCVSREEARAGRARLPVNGSVDERPFLRLVSPSLLISTRLDDPATASILRDARMLPRRSLVPDPPVYKPAREESDANPVTSLPPPPEPGAEPPESAATWQSHPFDFLGDTE